MHRILLALSLFATPVIAEDAALLLGVDRYDDLGRVSRGLDPLQAAGPLARFGFDIHLGEKADIDEIRERATQFAADAETANRLVVVLSGAFVTDGERTWFMAQDAAMPTLFGVAQDGILLDHVMAVLARTPGAALLVLAHDGGNADIDGMLMREIGPLDVPQGVTVITGTPRNAANYLDDVIAPDADIIAALDRQSGLTGQGYLPRRLQIIPADAEETSVPERGADEDEQEAWARARDVDTTESYLAYLRAYPQGQFAADAETQIAAISSEPNRADRLAEEALNLGRDARREIQRDLTMLGYNTRGVDGIFGAGSRRAIANWQQENGYGQTTYLTSEQVNRLDAQGARRAAEIELEEERARRAEEQRDRAFWLDTGASGTEAGLRAYLDSYPQGVFAEEARDALSEIEGQRREAAAAEDRSAWAAAQDANSIASYQRYLDTRPEGAFREEASARIAAAQSQNNGNADRAAAAAAEDALRLDPIARRLVEARLQQMDFRPGQVDGQFDERTRRAIRRYQQSVGIRDTGYLNQATIARLLADTFNSIQR